MVSGFASRHEKDCAVGQTLIHHSHMTAAKAALKRKKQSEHSLEQTLGQIGTLEAQINAIESANINRETLLAMERAGKAMEQIHGSLTPEIVDETMYVILTVVFIGGVDR